MATKKRYKKSTVQRHRQDADTKYNKGAMDSPNLKVHSSTGGLHSFGVGYRTPLSYEDGGVIEVPPKGKLENKSPGKKTGAKSDKDRDKSAEGIVQSGRRTLDSLSTPQMRNGGKKIKKYAYGSAGSSSSAKHLTDDRHRREAQKSMQFRYKKGTKKIEKMESGVGYYTGREDMRPKEAVRAPLLGGVKFFENVARASRLWTSVKGSLNTAGGVPDIMGEEAMNEGTSKLTGKLAEQTRKQQEAAENPDLRKQEATESQGSQAGSSTSSSPSSKSSSNSLKDLFGSKDTNDPVTQAPTPDTTGLEEGINAGGDAGGAIMNSGGDSLINSGGEGLLNNKGIMESGFLQNIFGSGDAAGATSAVGAFKKGTRKVKVKNGKGKSKRS